MKVPGVEFRRHSMKEERRRWSNTSATGDDLGLPPGAPGRFVAGACRRRSFSVTPKGGLVNEGDEVLPISAAVAAATFPVGGGGTALAGWMPSKTRRYRGNCIEYVT